MRYGINTFNVTAVTTVNDNDVSGVEAYLKKYPSKVNMRLEYRLTPLHYAADRGFVKVIEILILYSSEINAIDESGNTPIMTAAISGNKVWMHNEYVEDIIIV